MASPKTQFLILDGHALLHRAWHALPPMSTKDGLVTHGAYGFTTIMLNAIKKFQPEYMAVTFDVAGGTFRNEMYDEYKATREKKPDELYAQVDSIRKILDAMRIPAFSREGWEADDVIGTLSRMAIEQSKDVEVIIVTGDMDTLQLVDDRTSVFTMRKGMSDTVLYDVAAVEARFGFKPKQLIDYKALRGDPSDNIPGVRGIGEKTGTELIQQFGSVPALYEALDTGKADSIRESVREKLIASRANAMLALDLCRIRRDVPLDFALRSCEFNAPTREQVTQIFTELEFMKLLRQFPEGVPTIAAAPDAKLFAAEEKPVMRTESELPVVEVKNVAALGTAVQALSKAKSFAFRCVPADADPVAPKVLALGLTDGRKTYIVSRSAFEDGAPLLARLFAGKQTRICHDVKREVKMLSGAKVRTDDGFFDLMIASYLLHSGERRHALDALLAYERAVPLQEPAKTPEEAAERLPAELAHFMPMAGEFERELREHDLTKLYQEMELPLAEVLAQMERDGIAVDAKYLGKLHAEVGGEIEKLVKAIYKHAGREFNINSPAQLKEVLFDELHVVPIGLKKTTKGKEISTAAAELEKLQDQHPIIGDVLRYRELAKLQSTYIEPLPALVQKDGRIHAEFNQTVAATGRLSSANPNMQNIPTPETPYGKKVRDAFTAEKGFVLVAADYSQIELRIAAHLANEPIFQKAFRDGEDIHWRTAVAMFGEDQAKSRRRVAKAINFGILYGMGAHRLAESAEIPFAEAREFIDKYFDLHKGIAKYIEDTKRQVAEQGYVETLFGRKRFFKNVQFMGPRDRAEAERQAINMPIQGTNADMIKAAMVRIAPLLREKYGADARMLLQVHDELVFEVKEDIVDGFIKSIVPVMTGICALSVPVAVNVASGQKWGSLERIV